MKQAYIYALISILLWSTTATATKLLLGSLDSIQILTFSSLIAFIFLFIINIFKGNLREVKTYSIKDFLKIAGIGILGTFLYNLFLYLGIANMPASQAFTINYLWPIMTIIFAWIILKEKVTAKTIFAVILSFVGAAIVATDGNLTNLSSSNLIGAFFCFLAAASYGLFAVLVKKVHYDKSTSMMFYFLTSTIVALGLSAATQKMFLPTAEQFLGLCWIGIFTSAIAFTSWALALAKGDTAKISGLAYITPILSLVWAAIILGEVVSIFSVIGLVLILSGIIIQTNFKKQP